MITSPEQCRTDADVAEFERYLDFTYARRRLVRAVNAEPLVEAPGLRTLLTRLVFLHWTRNRKPVLPFGWSLIRVADRNAVIVGPSWYILPRRWLRDLRSWFYDFAVRVDLARCPYEGCYYSELRWFPDAPRFS